MIKQSIIEALKVISQKFKNRKIKWVLVGSVSLALQRVKISPKDIDILADKDSAFKMNKILKEYEVKPVKFGRLKIKGREFFKSYFGEFKINGVKVEIMGNLKEKSGKKWLSLSKRLSSPKIIEIQQGVKLPVSPLEDQLKSYSRLGRKKDLIRVQKIKEALKRQNISKLTKLGWDKTFKEKGKVFIKPEKEIPKVAKFFKKAGVKKILDLGCGSGRHLVYFAKRNFDIYGIDIAKEGLKIAKEWLEREKLKVNLKIGDMHKRLPYKDNFFDAVISIRVLNHGKIGEIRKTIREIKRILKSKGLIFVTVHKHLPKKKIPKDKLYGIKYIAPRTFVLLGGPEKGMIHYRFNAKTLKKEFKDFQILDFQISPKSYYCLLAKLKK